MHFVCLNKMTDNTDLIRRISQKSLVTNQTRALPANKPNSFCYNELTNKTINFPAIFCYFPLFSTYLQQVKHKANYIKYC